MAISYHFRDMDKWGAGDGRILADHPGEGESSEADSIMDAGWYENEVKDRSVAKHKVQYGDSDCFSIRDFELDPFPYRFSGSEI